jgi:hypothetical protein
VLEVHLLRSSWVHCWQFFSWPVRSFPGWLWRDPFFCLSARSVRERTFAISCPSWVSRLASGLVRTRCDGKCQACRLTESWRLAPLCECWNESADCWCKN